MDARVALHPSVQDLAAFAHRLLDDASSTRLTRHLDRCADCRKAVATLIGDRSLSRLPSASSTPLPDQLLGGAARDGGHFDPGALSAALAPSLPPELAGHPQYEVLRELGRGGMGVVYLARHRLSGRHEVLKLMNREVLARPGSKGRFLREIQSAALLDHPHVVKMYTALEVGELLVLVMEYVKGKDLASVVQGGGPVPVAAACRYVSQAALGLQHAFEKGMVHRDIKPHNLILTSAGNKTLVKVLDFGLAKALSEKGAEANLTAEGKPLGTPHYVAPEQIADPAHADVRADIYSLGCTFYCLLTGEPPFEGRGNLFAILHAHQSAEPVPVNAVRPEVPAEVAAVVARMMAKEPAQRYQRPVEVARALAPFLKPGPRPEAGLVLPPLPWEQSPASGPAVGGDTGSLEGPEPGSVGEAPTEEAPEEVPASPFADLAGPVAPAEEGAAEEAAQPARIPWFLRWPVLAGALLFVGLAVLVVILVLIITYREPAEQAPAHRVTGLPRASLTACAAPSPVRQNKTQRCV
jgi:serine/threonine protein kinase